MAPVDMTILRSRRERFLEAWGETLERSYGADGAERISRRVAEGAPLVEAELSEIDGAELVVWQELAESYRATTEGVRAPAAELIRHEARDLCDADWLEELDDACRRYGPEDGVDRWLALWLTHLEAMR